MKPTILLFAVGLACGAALAQFLPLAKEPGQAADKGDRGWILSLGGGLARDAAISQYISERAPEPALLSAYSSDIARQIGLQGALYGVGQRDPEAAHQLLDEYIDDPTLRAQAERILSNFE